MTTEHTALPRRRPAADRMPRPIPAGVAADLALLQRLYEGLLALDAGERPRPH